jgi:hypothetical protein
VGRDFLLSRLHACRGAVDVHGALTFLDERDRSLKVRDREGVSRGAVQGQVAAMTRKYIATLC